MLTKALALCALVAACAMTVQGGNFTNADGTYSVAWEVVGDELVVFIEAETLGFVGFGFSESGGLSGADVFLSGVDDGGEAYGFDMHGQGNQEPIVDESQDYEMIAAFESGNSTSTHFRRPLVVDDAKDFNITSDRRVYVLWSLGERDELGWNTEKSGAVLTHIFDQTEFTE